jgi:hypothetical protein
METEPPADAPRSPHETYFVVAASDLDAII